MGFLAETQVPQCHPRGRALAGGCVAAHPGGGHPAAGIRRTGLGGADRVILLALGSVPALVVAWVYEPTYA
jgi:hypothetical protein